jgi:hypothetical protein
MNARDSQDALYNEEKVYQDGRIVSKGEIGVVFPRQQGWVASAFLGEPV